MPSIKVYIGESKNGVEDDSEAMSHPIIPPERDGASFGLSDAAIAERRVLWSHILHDGELQ